MKSLLQENRDDIALIIGNGVNLYGPAGRTNCWRDLLVALANKHLPAKLRTTPEGVALTEFYDILELASTKRVSAPSLQQEFCKLMTSWECHEHHRRIVKWAQDEDVPILTTNFDQVLPIAGDCTIYRTMVQGFTDYYPWESYYSTKRISDPSKGFAIWHVNGMQHYHRSIRLGLSHYMGSVERARRWLHGSGDRGLFSGDNVSEWRGAVTWLQVLFSVPLLIFGLSLEQDEVFLRWLLIERARYFKKFPDLKKRAWYVHSGPLKNDGKRFFLEGVGVRPFTVDSYEDIYGVRTWS